MNRRNTESTNEILAILKQAKSALNHEMIQERASVKMDRATIYRVLNRFCEDKLVHKIVGDDGKQYFAFCTNCQEKHHQHNHFHFRCTECGKMECMQSEVKVPLPDGYVVRNFNGVISGVGSSCV